MLRWLGPRKAHEPPEINHQIEINKNGDVTDDPLAAIDPKRGGQQIYAVSRYAL